MKHILSFCFFNIYLCSFGMLTLEQIQQANDFSWPKDIVPALYVGSKDVKEDFFIRAFECVKNSDLNNEQKIHLYIWLLIGVESNGLTTVKAKICEFFSSSENLSQVCSYLLNYVKNPNDQKLEWDIRKYTLNRNRILTALYLIRDNVKKLPVGISRREIIHIYNQLASKAF